MLIGTLTIDPDTGFSLTSDTEWALIVRCLMDLGSDADTQLAVTVIWIRRDSDT